MIELAKELLKFNKAIKDTEEIVQYLKEKRDNIEKRLINEMVDDEVSNLSIDGQKIYLATRISVSPKSGRKDALFAALTDNGYADIIKPTINANTLTATVRELMEHNDNQIPEWLADKVSLYTVTNARIRKI
jgi:hypothetical protein